MTHERVIVFCALISWSCSTPHANGEAWCGGVATSINAADVVRGNDVVIDGEWGVAGVYGQWHEIEPDYWVLHLPPAIIRSVYTGEARTQAATELEKGRALAKEDSNAFEFRVLPTGHVQLNLYPGAAGNPMKIEVLR